MSYISQERTFDEGGCQRITKVRGRKLSNTT